MGVVSTAQRSSVPAEDFQDADVVSRAGAYRLVCAVLGDRPNWERFGRRRRVVAASADQRQARTDAELKMMADEITGTAMSGHTDGAWNQVFGRLMPLDASWLAGVRWMGEDDEAASGEGLEGLDEMPIPSLPDDALEPLDPSEPLEPPEPPVPLSLIHI